MVQMTKENTEQSVPTAEAAQDDLMANAMSDSLQDQTLRQERLRHVQEFITSPVFIDMRDADISVSDPREDLEERCRDIDYRLAVMDSVRALLAEERSMLERLLAQKDSGETADVETVNIPAPKLKSVGTISSV
ncbi:MAG: hypothetical protein JKX69_13620 [Rhodobacteraceae bacterium]|nr:hypothetical protein [Paracoccaceae bacterium]